MFLLLLSCYSAKINKMEQDILDLQQQNIALEAKIDNLEKELESDLESFNTLMQKSGAVRPPKSPPQESTKDKKEESD